MEHTKYYILTMVNAWCELVYLHHFTTKENARAEMTRQVKEEMMGYEMEFNESTQYEIGEDSAFVDNGAFFDRELYRWNITEILI